MQAVRIGATIVWILVLVSIGVHVYLGGPLFEDIQQLVTQSPKYSFAIFLLAYAIRPILLVPDSIMLIIGGLTFGPWVGFLGGYLGENISALIAFSVSRFLGNKWAHRSHISFVRKLDAVVTKRGFVTLMFLRLIPIAPFDPINYGAGLTSMSYRTFIAGTALGVIPALAVYVLIASALSDPKYLIVAGILIVFICVKLIAIRHIAPDIYSLGTRHHINDV